jgi:hypothetical protein
MGLKWAVDHNLNFRCCVKPGVGRLMLSESPWSKDGLIDYCRLMIPLIGQEQTLRPLFITTHLTHTAFPTITCMVSNIQ